MTSTDVYTASFSLSCNLACFRISVLYYRKLNLGKECPNFYLRFDYIGIILYIWATSISVLLLKVNDSQSCGYIILVITVPGLVLAVCLLVSIIGKRERILVVGGFGTLAFLAYSNLSQLTVSYVAMVTINSIGGWSYTQATKT